MVTATWYSESEDQTRDLGASLAVLLPPDGTLLLYGDLGSGKTVLTQGLAAAVGIDPLQVQSPSFTLIREHEGLPVRLVHIDLYRLGPDEVEELGLWEILAGDGLKVVEWAERLPFAVPGAIELEIRLGDSPDSREIRRLERPEVSDSPGGQE